MEGIADLCLHLQDEHGADVNMLLFACWYGATRGLLDETLFREAHAFSASWSGELTCRLRESRRWMKRNPPEAADENLRAQFQLLREQIKKLELEAEQFQENMLEFLVSSPARSLAAEEQQDHMRKNLQHYGRHIGIPAKELDTLTAPLIHATTEIT